MTNQEKKFANEYVMLFFHAPTTTLETAVSAAKYAGYDLSEDCNAAEATAKGLLTKPAISEYIKAEVDAFRSRFSGSQRRNLWEAIRAFEPGTPEDTCLGNIIIH